MTSAPSLAASPARVPPAPIAVSRSSVFLPKEHGSWSLALEPILLGLLVAPSGSGAALAVAAIAGFFARRPFKALLGQSSPRRPGALPAAILLGFCACAGLGEAAALAGASRLWPLLLAAPFGGLFVYFDTQGESREAAAEVAGSMAFVILPAAFATLAGWSVPAALALAAIALVRSVPTILTVRTYIRRRKGRPASAHLPVLTAAAGLALVVMLAALQQVPWLAVVGAVVLLARTVALLSPRAPQWSARRVGLTEALLGIGYIALAALAYVRW